MHGVSATPGGDVGDSTFSGGTLRGEFTIPRRVFDQLASRKRAWPIPWTAEDSLTTWLVPERLLLYAQFAEPDDKWDVRLRIDGQPVELRKAYTAVRVVSSTFVGFYADVSRLEPDRPHRADVPACGRRSWSVLRELRAGVHECREASPVEGYINGSDH
jgi:hypothetical protein